MTDITNTTNELGKLADAMRRRISRLEREADKERDRLESGAPRDYVVTSAFDLPLDFDVDERGRASRPRNVALLDAPRMSRPTAEKYAATVYDGTGARGRAVAYQTAIGAALHDCRSLLITIEEHLAARGPC